jgi:hypothetical protein
VFLWHFPWGRPRRALPGTVFPWSPDFPPPAEAKSGHPAVWLGKDKGRAVPKVNFRALRSRGKGMKGIGEIEG